MAKILIIDDDPVVLELLKLSLSVSGHVATISTNPAEFESLLDEHQPEAVVLDIKLPGRSGYDLLAQLRQHPTHKDLPVLFLTGLSSPKDKVKGLRSSADDYLSKPFELEELTLRLEKLIATRNRYFLSSGIQGSLDVYSLPELLQMLQREGRTGILTLVEYKKPVGEISLRQGEIVSAWHGALQGDDAILEMIHRVLGQFSFVIHSFEDVPISHPPASKLHNLLFLEALLRDEMSRISNPRIEPQERWWLLREATPNRPAGLPDLPFSALVQLMRQYPGSTQKELSCLGQIAPVRVQLSLMWLNQDEIISSKEPITPASIERLAEESGKKS